MPDRDARTDDSQGHRARTLTPATPAEPSSGRAGATRVTTLAALLVTASAAVLVAVLLTAPTTGITRAAAAQTTSPAGMGPKATRLFELLNAERRAHGLPELVPVPRLVELAKAQSKRMGADNAPCSEPWLHHNPNLDEEVQPAQAWGENVACAGDPEQMHEALMNSPGHRRNILGDWNAVGVGAYEGRLLWGTQVFATVSEEELAREAARVSAATATTEPAGPATASSSGERTSDVATTTTTARREAAGDVPKRWWLRVLRELRRWLPDFKLFGA